MILISSSPVLICGCRFSPPSDPGHYLYLLLSVILCFSRMGHVLISFNYHCSSISTYLGKESQLRNCPEIICGVCRRTSLLLLDRIGDSLMWVATIPRQVVLNSTRKLAECNSVWQPASNILHGSCHTSLAEK